MNITGWINKIWLFLLMPFFLNKEIHISVQKENKSDTVNIGFLYQDPRNVAALNGAILAIKDANREGGYSGKPFKLVMRSMEGPWGAGSKQAVDLIFEENVWGIVGSHDGRNAHLVEQACTKTNVVFLSAWASDPTLAQAFVPWFFNCIPDDIKQADILTNEIFNIRKFRSIALVSDNNYDSRNALKFFMRQAGKFKDYEILQISIQGEGKGLMAAAAELKKKNPQCLLMFCNTVNAYDLIQELKKNRLYLPLYSPIFIADENYDAFIKIRNSGYRVGIPAIRLHPSEFSSFAKNYEMEFGRQPGFSAALAYDAVRLLVEAIRNSGPEREKLQSYLLKCNYDGITGIIKFDELGNRLSIPGLVEI